MYAEHYRNEAGNVAFVAIALVVVVGLFGVLVNRVVADNSGTSHEVTIKSGERKYYYEIETEEQPGVVYRVEDPTLFPYLSDLGVGRKAKIAIQSGQVYRLKSVESAS